jgi:hypothetical protein
MKPFSLCAALVLLLACAATGHADQFSDIANNPNTYWVPPPNGYVAAPGPYGYYGGPPPPAYYYGPPPPAPLPLPSFFIHFRFR